MSIPQLDSSVQWTLNGGLKKSPHFNTKKQIPAARRGVYTASLMPYPTWDFEVSLENMTGTESEASDVYALFVGLFMQTNGGAGFWLFNDINDNTVSQSNGVMLNVTTSAATPMGQTGDGSSTKFQLARTIGGGVDILQNVSNVTIYVNGVQKTVGTDYTLSTTGVVTFASAPANNATLAWAGNFMFLCLFDDDTLADLALVAFNTTDELHSVTGIKYSSYFQ